MSYNPKPVLDRFLEKIEKVTESGCWLWTGHVDREGYARLWHLPSTRRSKPSMSQVHRFSYETFRGPIPDGLQIDHLCRVRCCVNPDHLEPVTLYDNIMRGDGGAAMNARKSHCKRGHEFTDENTGHQPSGRYCLECHRKQSRENHKKRKLSLKSFGILIAVLLLSACTSTPPIECDCAGQIDKLASEFKDYHICLNDRGLLRQRLKALEEARH